MEIIDRLVSIYCNNCSISDHIYLEQYEKILTRMVSCGIITLEENDGYIKWKNLK